MTSVSREQSSSVPWVGLGVFVVVTCTALILGGQVLGVVLDLPESAVRYDFRAFVTAGDIVDAGHSADVYDVDVQVRVQGARFGGIESDDDLLIFANPPFILPALALLAPLSTSGAFLALMAVTGLSLGLCVRLSGQLIGRGGVLVAVGILLGFPAVYTALVQGQFSGFLLAGLLGAWWADENDHPWRAGAWLALLALKPHLLLLPVVVLLAGRRWRILGGLCAAGSVLGAVGTAVAGLSGWRSWLSLGSEITSVGSRWGIKPRGMYTVRSFLHFVGETDEFSQVRTLWLGWVVLSVAVAIALGRQTNGLRIKREWGWGSLALLMLPASPHANIHDLLIVLVAVVAIVRLIPKRRGVGSLAAVGVATLWLVPVLAFATNLAPPLIALSGISTAFAVLWVLENTAPSARPPRVEASPRAASPAPLQDAS